MDMVSSMAEGAMLSLANPVPEIHPEDANWEAAIVGTGRSDFPIKLIMCWHFRG